MLLEPSHHATRESRLSCWRVGPHEEALEEKRPYGGEQRPQVCERYFLDLLSQPIWQMKAAV